MLQQAMTRKVKNRPIYENSETNAMEERFRGEFEGAFKNLKLRKLPRSYALDFAVWEKSSDRVVALIEYKQRKYTSVQMERWGGIKISLNKIKHALEYQKLFNVPVRLIYKLSDNLEREYYRFDVTEENVARCSVGFLELVSRGDWEDREPAMIIPMSLFAKKSI